MSVIGRLDEQVDAVLISPLKRKLTPDEAAREDARDAPTETPARSHEDRDAEPPDVPRETGDALPVWLL